MPPGRFPIHDLPDIGAELPERHHTTAVGLVLDVLGRMPVPGDEATVGGWQLHVRAMRGRAVPEITLVCSAGHTGEDWPGLGVGDDPTAAPAIDKGHLKL